MAFFKRVLPGLKKSQPKSFGKGKNLNVIILLIDGARADRLGSFPKFDSVLGQGTLFSNMVAYAPYTFGSTHAFITGMYGTENGVDSYYGSKKFRKAECKTLPEYLQEAGYYTATDMVSPLILPKQGFDSFSIHDENRDDLLQRHSQLIRKGAQLNKAGKNFFFFLQYSGIHCNWVKAVIKKFDDFSKSYFENMEKYVKLYDQYFAKSEEYLEGIFAELTKTGLLDSTVVVVFSDHGTANADKVGEKAYGVYCYDYTLKAFASFIHRGFFPEKQISLQTRLIDIMPTLLDLLGIVEDKKFKKMQGASLFPVIEGLETEERVSFSEAAGLGGPWPSPAKPNVHAIRSNNWKLIFNAEPKTFELYNLLEDPAEKNNLQEKFPEKKQELAKMLLQFKPGLREAVGDSL